MIDTHCHLDDARYEEDIEEVLKRAKEAGVERFIIPGADPDTLLRAVGLSQEYDPIYFAVGVHPYDICKYDKSYLERFVSHPKCVAIGECGLDYYRLPEDKAEAEQIKKLQQEVFVDQIKWAEDLNLPLIVHIREANSDALRLLKEHAGNKGGVLHCYNASEILLELADHNFYYGIGGVLTFKNAKKLPQMVLKIPKERLLLETDAPYLTPHPYRGKRNEPSYTALVAQKLSELMRLPTSQIEAITTKNAQRLFGALA